MNKLLFIPVLVFLFSGCNQNKDADPIDDSSTFLITAGEWPKKSSVNTKAQLVLNEWAEYKALDASFDALYTVENREDLILIVEDLIEKQKLLEASEHPEVFDRPQIKSRMKVFKTFFLKIKGNLEYRLDIEEPVLETIEAYNALRNQFNVVVNNTLDTKLILDE
ncbi:hypothetical protein ACEZ3G_04735 [Maribacter algicola]|uniref:Uncharacterized protein n=1 Tax=Meishania litoralis TaxID=3434685 RepID=A0ACC7LMH1_9FLAO